MSDNTPDKNTLLFTQLIITFQTAAMQQMGKIGNPADGKIYRDLTQAAISIDTLDMLKEKCMGNLSKDEDRLLNHVISELKLNYIDELNRNNMKKDELKNQAEKDDKEAQTEDNLASEDKSEE